MLLLIIVGWKVCLARTEKRMGGGDDPGRSVMCRVSLWTQPLGCNCGHHWGRLLERSAPQSGHGISHYQYDNNKAIHLVNLEVSSLAARALRRGLHSAGGGPTVSHTHKSVDQFSEESLSNSYSTQYRTHPSLFRGREGGSPKAVKHNQ